jgi:hypothetical protein
LLSKEEFIRISLGVNLFFQRIMKEHLFFIETALHPPANNHIAEAKTLKESFEDLLMEAVSYANGVISETAIGSHELVTPFTLRAEQLTSTLTGAGLDTQITIAEYQLVGAADFHSNRWLEDAVTDLNRRSYNLLELVIAFQKRIIAESAECKIFISLYPELLEHVTREAELYLDILRSLQQRRLPEKPLCAELNFWNNIMAEHAEFIDGFLDPTEKMLKEAAENFADRFDKLVKYCMRATERQIIRASMEAAQEIREFKRAATEGLLNCSIKSIIPPLLGDHVLREANHFLRLLQLLRR